MIQSQPTRLRPFLQLACALSLTACGTGAAEGEAGETASESSSETGAETETGDPSCDAIELPGDLFFPESIAVDSTGVLYITSAAQGAIWRVDPCTDDEDYLVAPGTDLRGAGGIAIDEATDRLYVCDDDLSGMSPPEIDVFELSTGTLVSSHVLEPVMAFCNDVTLDSQGNVYATNSIGTEIVKVAAEDIGSDAPASVWVSDPRFALDEGQTTGINGLAFDGTDALYVGMFALGSLHRITIAGDGSAGAVEDITLAAPLAAPDGLRWDAGSLVVTEIASGTVSRVELDGLNATASVIVDGLDTPTSLALIDSGAWVVESQLDHLLGMDPAPPSVPFMAKKVSF